MIRYAIALLALSIVAAPLAPARADQERKVKPNDTAKAQISLTDLTRLRIEDDRVKRIVQSKVALESMNDPDTGDVYFRPGPFDYSVPYISLYVVTEKGHTVRLRLTPVKKLVEDILLRIEGAAAAVAATPTAQPQQSTPASTARGRAGVPFVTGLTRFLARVINADPALAGTQKPATSLLGYRPTASYADGGLIADVYLRQANAPAGLQESDFHAPGQGVAAVWFSGETNGAPERVIVLRAPAS